MVIKYIYIYVYKYMCIYIIYTIYIYMIFHVNLEYHIIMYTFQLIRSTFHRPPLLTALATQRKRNEGCAWPG